MLSSYLVPVPNYWTQEKLKELEIIYQNGIYICISWYSKIADFGWKNADVSRTQGMCHVTNILYGPSLDKV